MRLLKCLSQDCLLEYVSIPQEVSAWKKLHVRLHTVKCDACQNKLSSIRKNWDSYFAPETDITSSLLKVYSRLQTDETLILKGWKLGEFQRRRDMNTALFKGGWLFRGAVSLGLAGLAVFVVLSQVSQNKTIEPRSTIASNQLPLAQIRVEEKNTVKVHYLEPELLQTIEFETTRGSR